jgi:hypothetical protein
MAEGGFPSHESRDFWLLLPYVLPCKFCRASLGTYYKKYPVPTKGSDLPKWLWSIHNCVNSKLRSQGLPVAEDPPFEMVHAKYKSQYEQGCTRTNFPGWIFLFCICDNHPKYGKTSPMNDVPTREPTSFEDRNIYNLLTPDERLIFYKQFFKSIPHAFPYEEWRLSWNKHSSKGFNTAFKNRSSLLKWLYTIQCGMNKDLNWLAKDSYYGLCKVIRDHRSGCGSDKHAKTCRRKTQKKERNPSKQRVNVL